MSRLAFFWFLACLTGTAQAAPQNWTILPEASALSFVYLIDGKEREGDFQRFVGAARFDPDDTETAVMVFEIETASIDAGEPFATEFVRSVDWLFVEEHPRAHFELTRMTRQEGDRFLAEGLLTMRGVTQPVSGEMVVTLTQDAARATGEVRVDRKDFKVGVGFTTLFVEVGREIAVRFDLTAAPDG